MWSFQLNINIIKRETSSFLVFGRIEHLLQALDERVDVALLDADGGRCGQVGARVCVGMWAEVFELEAAYILLVGWNDHSSKNERKNKTLIQFNKTN